MSPTRVPNDEEIALAESVFGIFQLFKSLAIDAAHLCALGSPERARMLYGLKAGPLRAGLLAQRAKLSPSAITEIVEGMESDGLVRREADPDDRRAVRVALTADGRRHLQRFEQAAAVSLAESLSSLTPAQRQRVRAAFNDLREAIPTGEFKFMNPSHPEVSLRPKAYKEVVSVR